MRDTHSGCNEWTGLRGACILLVSREGKVLLNLRSSDPRVMYPGRWAFVSGGVESEEAPREAIIRETWEEAHYTLSSPILLWENVHTKPKFEVLDSTFVAPYDGQTMILGEGEDLGWFSLEEALALNPPEHEVQDLKRFFSKKSLVALVRVRAMPAPLKTV